MHCDFADNAQKRLGYSTHQLTVLPQSQKKFVAYYAPIKVRPHLPPSGHRWGHGWGFDNHAVNDPTFGPKSEFKCHQIPV